MARFNGGIIGSRNLTTGGGIGQGTAAGIWSLNEAQVAKIAGIWPQEIASGTYGGVQIFTETTSWTAGQGVTQVDYLIVAGGGGGGGDEHPQCRARRQRDERELGGVSLAGRRAG